MPVAAPCPRVTLKKKKVFHLQVKPRYLPGQALKDIMVTDLAMYNKHRWELFTATYRVDVKPFPMDPMYYLNKSRLLSDKLRLQEIDKENKMMLRKINRINRLGGQVDSYNPVAYERRSNYVYIQRKNKEIMKENITLYKKIVSAVSEYSTSVIDDEWRQTIQKLETYCKYPLIIKDKKSVDQIVREQPSISEDIGIICGCNRAYAYMDFKVREGVYLGRIVIELYDDIVPVTVQNFYSICCRENKLSYKNCPVHRAVPGEYIELGDITKGNGKGGTSIYGETFPEENHVLKHKRAGVLSAIPVGKKVNNSQFSITLKAMEKFDGDRVVFGKVIKGIDTLCKISDLGKRYGSPSAPIQVYDCGKFIKGKTLTRIRNFKYF